MKILTVVGARPNFMKAAPIIGAINERNKRVSADFAEDSQYWGRKIEHILVHTGQHYDDFMSGSFFNDLNLPKPDVHLGIGSGSHAVQTAEIMRKFEGVVCAERPDVVVVVGDVNSTLACALVVAKIAFDSAGSRPLIAHVEAGLRSFDMSMPEEINRILTDHVSDLLLVTEESGLQNLQKEGVCRNKIHFVGNTMIDSLLSCKEKAEASTILEDLGLRTHGEANGSGKDIASYGLLTLHRPSNVDNSETFMNILGGLEELEQSCPIIFPVHPRTQRRIRELGIRFHDGKDMRMAGNGEVATGRKTGIVLTNPLGYLDFLCLMKHATIVVTDSGGIQEETTCLGIPCVTVRENTERPVTVERGTNLIAGTSKQVIRQTIQQQLRRNGSSTVPKNWDGQAATRILDILIGTFMSGSLMSSPLDPLLEIDSVAYNLDASQISSEVATKASAIVP